MSAYIFISCIHSADLPHSEFPIITVMSWRWLVFRNTIASCAKCENVLQFVGGDIGLETYRQRTAFSHYMQMV